jgi:hypothetical protein
MYFGAVSRFTGSQLHCTAPLYPFTSIWSKLCLFRGHSAVSPVYSRYLPSVQPQTSHHRCFYVRNSQTRPAPHRRHGWRHNHVPNTIYFAFPAGNSNPRQQGCLQRCGEPWRRFAGLSGDMPDSPTTYLNCAEACASDEKAR